MSDSQPAAPSPEFQTPVIVQDGFEPSAQHQHAHRNSIYLPLGTTSNLNNFPFAGLPALPTPLPPKSPSNINPIYADPNAPLLPVSHAPLPSPYDRLPSPKPQRPHQKDLPPLLAMIPPAILGPLDTPTAWLIYYFFANLGLTLYNKLVLVRFPFPWTMTGIHCLACTLGCLVFYQQGLFNVTRITQRESLTLVAFSSLYALNIAISNVSLNLASVPFHQVIRATTPIFTIIINVLFLKKTYATRVMVSLLPVVLGVGLATFGDYHCTAAGFFLTILGAFLASLKGVATNLLLVGSLRLHPLDLLLRMSPLAFVQCVAYAWATGELDEVRAYGALEMSRTRALSLAANGTIAFFLNVVSFSANKKTSALTMTVAGNVKQCLTIILAVWLFDVAVSFTNSVGIALTLAGGAWYARENYVIRQNNTNKERMTPLTEVVMNEKFGR